MGATWVPHIILTFLKKSKQTSNRLGLSDEAFIAAHPEALEGIHKLVGAIRRKSGRMVCRRKSRNGTPEERDRKRQRTMESLEQTLD